jgi:hypothetical protein
MLVGTEAAESAEFDFRAVILTPAALHISTPNDPSRWGLGTRQRLSWTYQGDAPQVQIDISRDAGNTWDFLSVVPNRSGGSQNFFWTVTGPETPNARLRVAAIGDEEATDVNDADIRIAGAFIEFVLPHRRTVAALGTPFRIFFKHNIAARRPVAIDVSGDDGTTWRTVTARTETMGSSTSSFRWIVDLLPTTRARLRIRALDGSGAVGLSESFKVGARSGTRSWTLLPCSLQRCGEFPQNVATLGLGSGTVNIEADGLVTIRIRGLSELQGNAVAANKTLEVWRGVFNLGERFDGLAVGFVSIDAAGNYEGPVITAGGTPYIVGAGRGAFQIILNDPAVRSEFVTKIIVR